jgi:hypothetical protein
MFWCNPVALSVSVMAAVNGPAAAGVKCPWMVHDALAARVVPQLFAKTNEAASVPVTAMLWIDSGEPPVLIRVTDCELLCVPTGLLPNDRLVDESETSGGVPPVPLNAIVCGEPAALSVMVMTAGSEPVAVGVKCPWMVQAALAARLDPQLFANTYEEPPVPPSATLVMASGNPPVLVRVTDCEAL